MNQRKYLVGFTLLELMLSISILAVLCVLALVGGKAIQERAKDSKCMANLKQIGVPSSLYIAENKGMLPVGLESSLSGVGSAWDGDNFGAWYWNVAPYLNVDRWASVRKYLGKEEAYVQAPNVFTCPSHGKEEVAPIKFPSIKPVSYAMSNYMAPSTVTEVMGNYQIARFNINQITGLSKKYGLATRCFPMYSMLLRRDGRRQRLIVKLGRARHSPAMPGRGMRSSLMGMSKG